MNIPQIQANFAIVEQPPDQTKTSEWQDSFYRPNHNHMNQPSDRIAPPIVVNEPLEQL
jgi:hypothetical protein